ncbi:MAG: hypothetical protein C5B48_05940 [Candidatus Rokuibacteriota bacterium]|nr:MAG: hypothetical protein C5B48_05940 [Candidatus Rokubacteria bacterium]
MSDLPRFEDFYDAHPELFDQTTSTELAVVAGSARAVASEAIRLPGTAALAFTSGLPAAVSLMAFQTPLKFQGSRGTCYAFATCAAMEAAYSRQFGVTLDLSEQYAFHINKVTELFGNYLTDTRLYENNSSMWGFQGCSDLVGKLSRAAIPSEDACRYLDDPAMKELLASLPAAGDLETEPLTQEQLDTFEFAEGHIPTSARVQARFQVKSFAVLPPMPATDQIESVLAAGHEVVVDIPNHCVLVVGYDRNQQRFTIKDSAIPAFGTLDYNSTALPIKGGYYITEVHPPSTPPRRDAWWLGRWAMNHDGFRGELVIRRTTSFYKDPPGQPTKFGNYYRDGHHYDVAGELFEDGQGMRFWVADTTAKSEPGAKVGQPFVVYAFSGEPDNAAGTTTWSGMDFGVRLTRTDIPKTYTTSVFVPSDWIGTWLMNHDGHHGTLTIADVEPFSAEYTGSDGSRFPVRGGLTQDRPHVLQILIPFDSAHPQPFHLFVFTHEKGTFAGTTTVGATTLGVHGRRPSPAETGGFESIEVDAETLSEVLIAQGRRLFMVGGGMCESREFDYREFATTERHTHRALNFRPDARLTWHISGIDLPAGDFELTVPVSPLSPDVDEPDGADTPASATASISGSVSGTTMAFTNNPDDRSYWLDVEVSSDGGRRAAITVRVSARRFDVPGLPEANDHCFSAWLNSLQTETPVEVVPLLDPPYPGEMIDPRLDVVLRAAPAQIRTAIVQRIALISSLVPRNPADAAAVAAAADRLAVATERTFSLPSGTVPRSRLRGE